jgi:hypothetical protein
VRTERGANSVRRWKDERRKGRVHGLRNGLSSARGGTGRW